MNQSTCEGGTVNFTCVVMFTSVSPGPAIWLTDNGNIDANGLPGHSVTDDSEGLTAPANVTTVLSVTNVAISNNGADYVCSQGVNIDDNIAYLTVFGELSMHLCMFVTIHTYVHIYDIICMKPQSHGYSKHFKVVMTVFGELLIYTV